MERCSFLALPCLAMPALIDAHLVRVALLRDRLEVDYRADPKDRSETDTLPSFT